MAKRGMFEKRQRYAPRKLPTCRACQSGPGNNLVACDDAGKFSELWKVLTGLYRQPISVNGDGTVSVALCSTCAQKRICSGIVLSSVDTHLAILLGLTAQ